MISPQDGSQNVIVAAGGNVTQRERLGLLTPLAFVAVDLLIGSP